MKKTPISPGRKRTYNYTYIRELFQDRRNFNPGYSKAELARELGLSTRTIRGILNGTYERRFLRNKENSNLLDTKVENEEQKDEDDEFSHLRNGLLVAWT